MLFIGVMGSFDMMYLFLRHEANTTNHFCENSLIHLLSLFLITFTKVLYEQ